MQEFKSAHSSRYCSKREDKPLRQKLVTPCPVLGKVWQHAGQNPAANQDPNLIRRFKTWQYFYNLLQHPEVSCALLLCSS
eukprot:1157804-Pelagomonas_calceolata.AAC.1